MESKTIEQQTIILTIKRCAGNKIKYERDNDGLRERVPTWRKKWINAKFVLPSGKKKCDVFPFELTDQQVLEAIQKRYSNLKFEFNTQSK